MKVLYFAALTLLACFQAAGQISMELAQDQDQFLPNEAIRMAVKITNQSGQPLHLGADPSWLTFNVESADGFVVVKNSEVPVVEEFDLESSQMATKHVDLQPHFQLSRPGRYKVTATMRIPQWSLTVNSAPIKFDIMNGGELWSQDFGVTVNPNDAPDSRKYSLIKANYLREQLRLYVQVTSADGTVFKVSSLGPMVSFSLPEQQVDRSSQLHVLWQTGSQSFGYVLVGVDGTVISRDIYDNFNSRPHLTLNDNGGVIVHGGVRRLRAGEIPPVTLPSAPSVPATNR